MISIDVNKLPWSCEAEQSVLGSLLIDNDVSARVNARLSVNSFWHAPHRAIFETIMKLIGAGQPADVVTVYQALDDAGLAEGVGGLAHLNDLAQSVPSSANVHRYAEIVADKCLRRTLMVTADNIAEHAQDAESADAALDRAQTMLAGIKRIKSGSDPRSLAELMVERSAYWEALQNGTDVSGIPTGLRYLDGALGGGIKPGRVIVLAARPSVGKTSLATQILLHVGGLGHSGLMLSQEMPAGDLMDRAAAHLGGVDLGRLATGSFVNDDWTRISDATDQALKLKIFVDDTPALTLLDIRAKARQVQRNSGLALLVIDYLQLSSSGAANDTKNRHHQIEAISRGLKVLAKEMGLCVLLLSQLNRSAEGDEPDLHHLKESGAIEEDADVVMLLHPMDQEPDGSLLVLLKIAKNRQGQRGRLALAFDGATQRWSTSTGDVSRKGAKRA